MKKIDKLVCAPHFYTMEGEGVGYRANAAMAHMCVKIRVEVTRRWQKNAFTGLDSFPVKRKKQMYGNEQAENGPESSVLAAADVAKKN